MTYPTTHTRLNYLIAAVWLVNGLFCKVLNLVPRHQAIVARVMGMDHPRSLTILIGLAETLMAIWILSGVWPRLNVLIQILVIAIMNSLEFFLAPDLLLWGRWNALFAFIFLCFIYYSRYYLHKKTHQA